MKVKELIRRLQEADPTGEEEACVDNFDIHFVENLPAYFDGRLQVLQRDPKRTDKCYDICGAEIRGHGRKVRIHTLSIEQALCDDPALPVTFDSATMGYLETDIDKWRIEANRA